MAKPYKLSENDMVEVIARGSKQKGRIGVIRGKGPTGYHIDNMYGEGNLLFPHHYCEYQLRLHRKSYLVMDENSPCGAVLKWRRTTIFDV